jgi:hypothetical protein
MDAHPITARFMGWGDPVRPAEDDRHINVLGGCRGADHRHVERICPSAPLPKFVMHRGTI